MKKILAFCIGAFLIIGSTYAQEKTTMDAKDLPSSASKYIKKNYKDYTTSEAYQYNPIYAVKIEKADTTNKLAFNDKGKFLYVLTADMETKISTQPNTTMAIKDVQHDITKYVEKNYKDYKIIEADQYETVYSAKVVKGSEEVVLIFNEKGEFLKVAE